MRSFRHGVSVILVVLASGHAGLADDEPQSRLLKSLGEMDRALAGGFSATFIMSVPASPFDPAQGTVSKECSMTWAANAGGLKTLFLYELAPVYRKPGTRGYLPLDYDESGNLIVWRSMEKFGLAARDINDSYDVKKMFVIDPQGKVLEEETYSQLYRYKLGSNENIYEFGQFRMAAGRGFTEYIDKVTKMDSSKGGAVEVEARGSYGSSPGTWQLTVEPAAHYLVRKATFTADGKFEPMLVVTTSGQTTAGKLTIADQGTVRHRAASTDPYEVRVDVMTFTASVDKKLLALLRARVTAPIPPKAGEVVDFRGPEPKRTVPDNR